MSTSAITSTSSTTSTTGSSNALASLGTEDFLKLLLAQLENQDPFDPVDSGEMTSQVCMLTQVSQAVQTNEYLSSLVQYASSTYSSQAVTYIGKTISYSNNEIAVSSGAAGTSSFTLASDAGDVVVTVYDADGNTVNTVDLGSLSAGASSFTWDCTDSSGATVEAGSYTFAVSAVDTSGNSVSVSTGGTAEATGVVYKSGVAYLVTASGNVPLEYVTAVT